VTASDCGEGTRKIAEEWLRLATTKQIALVRPPRMWGRVGAGKAKEDEKQVGSPTHRKWKATGEEEEDGADEEDGYAGEDTEPSASISLMDEVRFPISLLSLKLPHCLPSHLDGRSTPTLLKHPQRSPLFNGKWVPRLPHDSAAS
jgi:hypothetical protein